MVIYTYILIVYIYIQPATSRYSYSDELFEDNNYSYHVCKTKYNNNSIS